MDKIFYKYKPINEYTLDSLKEHYFYFSDKDELNDPFDIKIPSDYSATDQDIIDWGKRIHQDSQFINKIINDKTIIESSDFINKMDMANEKMLKRLRIFCVSEIWNEELMWGHYADSFKGVCFGYTAYYKNKAYLLKLDKDVNTGMNFINKDNDIMILLNVEYEKTTLKPYNLFKYNIEVIQEGFKYKRPKWSYEKEYRALYTDMTNPPQMKKIKYSKDILREIIFGFRTTDNNIKIIREIVSNEYDAKNIKFYRILIPDNILEIQREEI
ncbi:MAG: DUF2971 domain-containing protein [Spirochaetaceae bacterium]|jgi:hypothetical protein|nr:DUF2971 domain-containing protein [Spirochaetaceae bacterium]